MPNLDCFSTVNNIRLDPQHIGTIDTTKALDQNSIVDSKRKIESIRSDQTTKALLSPTNNERGLSSSPFTYIFTALIIGGGMAASLFSLSLPAFFALTVVASWFLWSGAIILANRAFEGTKIAKPIHLLHAAASEFNAGVASALLFPLTVFKKYHAAKGDLSGRPILLVNGYLSFGSTWHYMRNKLVENGFGPVYTMNVGSGRSIKTYAKHLEKKIEQIQKQTKRDDIMLIGHSKGGLVSSEFVTSLPKESKTKVTDVVTIGSPLAGTPVAYLGIGHDAAEMRSGSLFHKELRERIKETADRQHTRFFHVGSESDEVVPLSSSLIGEDPNRQLRLNDMGHLSLVYSSRVADQVCSWLKDHQD